MNDVMLHTLEKGLPDLGLNIPAEIQEKLCAFAQSMVKQNR